MKTFLEFFTEAVKASKSDVDFIINKAFADIDKAIADNTLQKPIVLSFISKLRAAIKEEAFVSDYKKQISNTLDALGLRRKANEVPADVDKLKELFQLTDIEPTQPEQAPQPVISPQDIQKSKQRMEGLIKFASDNKSDSSKRLEIQKQFNELRKELSRNKFFEIEENKSELPEFTKCVNAIVSYKNESQLVDALNKLIVLFDLNVNEVTEQGEAPEPDITPEKVQEFLKKIEDSVTFAVSNKDDSTKRLQIRRRFSILRNELDDNGFFTSKKYKSSQSEFDKIIKSIIQYTDTKQLVAALNNLIVLLDLNIDEVTEKAPEPIISQENIDKSLDEIEKAIDFSNVNKDDASKSSEIKRRFYALRNQLTTDNFFKSEYYKSTQQAFGKIVDLISQYKDTKELISLLNRIIDLFDLQIPQIVDSELAEPTTDVENPDKLFTTISNKIREKLKPAKQETLADKIKWLFMASPNNSRY